MIVGIPREIKNNEYRVSLVPAGVDSFIEAGHEVVIEVGAGLGSGILDEDYERAGAKLVAAASDIYAAADMIVK